MEKVTFNLPSMWADHHVLAVRRALGSLPGVDEVTASALYKDVLVNFDAGAVSSDALSRTLEQAGFPVAQAPELPHHPKRIDDSSDWFRFQERITETDMRDIEMSGDHRKY